MNNKATIIIITLILMLLNSPVALALYPDYEDFLANWTELDSGSDITVTASDVSWTGVRHDADQWVIYDFGTDNITQSIDVDFEFTMDTGTDTGGGVAHWGVANATSSLYDLSQSTNYGLFFQTVRVTTPAPYYRANLQAYYSTPTNNEASTNIGISLDTTYYATVRLIRSASVNGTAYLYIYTDSDRASLLGQTSLVLDEDNYYQYMYALDSTKNPVYGGGNYDHFGSTSNMLIQFIPDPPTAFTGTAVDNGYDPYIGYNADLYGNVTDDGNEASTASFYYIDYTDNISGWQWANATGTYTTGENFTTTIYPLLSGHTYQYFSRVTNSAGYDDGNTENFTVSAASDAPVIDTLAYPIITNAANLTAVIYGSVYFDGGDTDNVTGWLQWRLATSENWTTTSNTTGLGTGNMFSANLSGLSLATLYQYVAYGQNAYGSHNGGVAEFMILDVTAPTVETVGHSNVLATTAVFTGNLTDMGNDDVVIASFRYREVGNIDWTYSPVTPLSAIGTYTQSITGLSPATNYEFTAMAVSGVLGSPSYYDYGDLLSFATLLTSSEPVMTTGNATYQGYGQLVTLRGSVYYDGGYSVSAYFQYRLDGSVDWTNDPVVTDNLTTSNGALTLISVDLELWYEYRIIGNNVIGQGVGATRLFRLTDGEIETPDTIIDNGGTIGLFEDMVNNVKTSLRLTGIMGTWAFMGLLLLIIAIIFGSMTLVLDGTARTALAVVWALLSISVVGAFIFAGELGIWPILILVGGVSLIVMIVVGTRLSGSNT